MLPFASKITSGQMALVALVAASTTLFGLRWVQWPSAAAESPAQTDGYTSYIPQVSGWPVDWQRIDSGAALPGLWSIAACKTDDMGFFLGGADDGLHERKGSQWEPAITGVPGPVRDIVFNDDCSKAYLAVYGGGVWLLENRVNPSRVGAADSVLKSRDLVFRDKQLFAGTDGGVFVLANGEWKAVGDPGIVTDLSLDEDGTRLYATVWQEGVRTNDQCEPSDCPWADIDPPAADNQLFRIAGYQEAAADRLVLGTAKGLYRRDGAVWIQAPAPTGTVFALEHYSQDGDVVVAGVQVKGAWYSADGGATWAPVGGDALQAVTVVDFVLQDGWLYAATYTNGLWRFPAPGNGAG